MNLPTRQKRICEQVINVFETGSIQGDYSSISIYHDGPHGIRQVTYGRSQTTEYGNLQELIEMYVDAEGIFSGTVVEIGIDYFVANPQALGKDSSARRVVAAFLVGINDVDFAEGESIDVVGDVLMAALKVLGDNATLVSNDTRIHVLLGGVTDALRNDLKEAGKSQLGQSLADEIKTEERLVPQDHPIRKAMEAIRLQ